MSDERVAKLLDKCKSTDNDVRVAAVNELRTIFETGDELADFDGCIQALKSCLRTPNQHLTTATLAALPPFFHLLVLNSAEGSLAPHDATLLRQTLMALLPTGGMVDRLGDSREKARESAREALVTLGTIIYRHSGVAASSLRGKESAKGQEPPMAIYERSLRELGLGSKVWRVREQAILTLVHLRRANPGFPIKQYLGQFVATLEDSDGTVRDCARASIIEIFTAAGVTDAARADLKKELTKQNVRKTIVDSILAKLMTSTPSGSATPAAPAEEASTSAPSTLPSRRPTANSVASSSVLSRATSMTASASERPPSQTEQGPDDVRPVFIASAKDLEHEFSQMLPHFEGKESEHNWLARDKAITRIRGMVKGEVHQRFTEHFLHGLRSGMLQSSLKTLASLRTVVSTNTCSLYAELVDALGPAFDPFVETVLTPLARMATFTKKIVAAQTQSTIKDILENTSAQPRIILPVFFTGMQDKNVQARQYMVAHIRLYMQLHGNQSRHAIEASGGVDLLDKAIRKALGDANIGVREAARPTFWDYHAIWRDKALLILGSLDANNRKQLEKACPATESGILASLSSEPEPRKTSLAAAIAASRAKAKQIAADPPTLRHAATAHATVASQAYRRPASPAMVTSGSNSQMRSSSPTFTARRTSNAQRTGSAPAVTQTVTLSRPGLASAPSSPPTSPSAGHQRRISSSSPIGSPQRTIPSPTQMGNHLRSSLSARSASPPAVMSTSYSSSSRRLSMQSFPPISAPFSAPSTPPMRGPPTPVSSHKVKDSASIPGAYLSSDEDMLMRLQRPGSETDSDESHPPNFSTPFEISQGKQVALGSGLTPSTTPLRVPGPVIEDALRARAEQAESAAERLLEELAEPDTEPPPFPPSLLASTSSIPGKTHAKTPSLSRPVRADIGTPNAPLMNNSSTMVPPTTPPSNRHAALLKRAALFQDSPAAKPVAPSIVDMLKENRHESGWWLKRITLIQQAEPYRPQHGQAAEIKQYIATLESGSADVQVLKKLALICNENPVAEDELPSPPLTPSRKHVSLNYSPAAAIPVKPLRNDVWETGRLFDELLAALTKFLTIDKEDGILEYGLIVLWEMLDNQQSYLEGRESEVLALLFKLRYCEKQNVAEATNAIRDALVSKMDPVLGLTTMNASLKRFLSQPIPSQGSKETRSLAHAFGLLALGKFLLRLPADILEEELPRMKATLTEALNDPNLLVRESAAAAITAAQLVLRDETYLFTLLDNLAPEKKNLLTYLFDKHGARGNVEGVSNGAGTGSINRLEKEMKRLDTRTSTPSRRAQA